MSDVWYEWYAVWPDPRSRSQALESWKSFHFQKLSPQPFTMAFCNWPLILKLGHNISIWSGRIFGVQPSFCVTWIWSWQKRQLWRVDRQSCTGLIYYNFICWKHAVNDHRPALYLQWDLQWPAGLDSLVAQPLLNHSASFLTCWLW